MIIYKFKEGKAKLNNLDIAKLIDQLVEVFPQFIDRQVFTSQWIKYFFKIFRPFHIALFLFYIPYIYCLQNMLAAEE